MIVTTKNIDELRSPERNVRKHGDKQIEEYCRSIEMFGQIRPVICDETGEILAGNGLVEAMRRLGRTTVECYVMEGLDEKAKKKLMLADNRIFNLGSDNLAVFEAFVAEMDGDFDIPGYDVSLLEMMSYDTDDVDEMQSNYGIISAEEKAKLERAEERYAENAVKMAQSNVAPNNPVTSAVAEDVPVTAHEAPSEPVEIQRKYVICPHCGERIWL